MKTFVVPQDQQTSLAVYDSVSVLFLLYFSGDHTESVEIEYDPSEVSYETLLTLFWNNHDPFSPRKRQYMSAIFYHNEEQKHLAEESMKVAQSKSKRKVVTQILPAERFYDAEE